MPKRLTPAGASAIVVGKLKAQQAAEEEGRAVAAQRAAEARAWTAQSRKLITAACEGHYETTLMKQPIRPSDLLGLGFSIVTEAETDQLAERDQWARELSEIASKQDAAMKRLSRAVSAWVDGLIDWPMKHDLETEILSLLSNTRFSSVENSLDPEFLASRSSVIEPGDLILSAIEIEETYDWLQSRAEVRAINRELSQMRTLLSERRKIKKKLSPFERIGRTVEITLGSEREVLSTSPPFKISWRVANKAAHWPRAEMVSAKSLAWFAGPGQLMLETMESMVSEAADSMKRNAVMEIRYTNRNEHILAHDGPEIVHFPPSDELAQVLTAVGWTPRVCAGKNGDYTLTLSW